MASVLLGPVKVGHLNRSRILQALSDHGPLSRAQLAGMTGVPRGTIAPIVRPLLEQGVLEEQEPRRLPGRSGKPGRPLWFAPTAGLSASIVLSEDACGAALVNARGETLDEAERALTDRTSLRAVVADVLAAARAVLPRRRASVIGLGVAVPGICDTATGTVVGSSQIPGLNDSALGAELADRIGLAVLVDNDSRAQALGEKWFGEGRGVPTFAAVQTGHGLGVGLVIDGRVFRGRAGGCGELGHVAVVPDGALCRCGLRGCWETVATLQWLRSEARRRGMHGRVDAARLAARAEAGHDDADDLLDAYADRLAMGLSVLVHLFNPERIILHGDAVRGGQPFLRRIVEHTRRRTLVTMRDGLEIVLSTLDPRAGLLGAAALVLSETYSLSA